MKQTRNGDLRPTCDKCQWISFERWEKRGHVQQAEIMQLRANVEELKAILCKVQDELDTARNSSCWLRLRDSEKGE